MVSHSNVLELIGNTPLVELSRIDAGVCQLLVKLENHNPGGSIKDRIGRSMIEAAERAGLIGPGSTLVEATAGNTGIGLALVAAQKGYRLTLVIPGQDEPGESVSSQGPGGQRGDDAQRRRPRTSRLLSRPGRADHARNSRRLLHQSVQQSGQSAGPRNDDRPGNLGAGRASLGRGRVRRRFGRNDHRAEPVLCRRGAAGRNRAGRSGRLDPGRLHPDRPIGHGRLVAGGRDRRGFFAADRRLVARPHGLLDQRRRKPGDRARAAQARRDSGRLVERNAGRRRAALLPRAKRSPSAW